METVTISRKEYDFLVKRSFELQCLYEGGVENWVHYDDVIDIFSHYDKFMSERGKLEDL